jgi:MoaA/NifB/PqqE/SkfB family radical SAM enzyme
MISNKIKSQLFHHAKKAGQKLVFKFGLTTMFSPLTAAVEITTVCNMNCPMCNRSKIRIHSESMDVDKFRLILDKLPRLKQMTFMGLGETLLHPNICAILQLCAKRNIYTGVVTNGFFLREEFVNKLPKVTSFCVSIDSPVQSQYEKIRTGDLTALKKNLMNLKKIKSDSILNLQLIMMKDNIPYLNEFVRLAKDVHADGISLINLMPISQGLWDIHAHSNAVSSGCLDGIKASCDSSDIRFVAGPLQPHRRFCTAPFLMPYIKINGDVLACPYMNQCGEEWYGGTCRRVDPAKFIMGNIFENSIAEIWNSDRLKTLRKIMIDSENRFNKNRSTTMTPQDFVRFRESIDFDSGYDYCKTCLYRWGCSC